jgi:transcriptional regulator with XRE-family HTH domain
MTQQRRRDLLKKFGKRLAYFRNKKRLSLRYLAAASRLDPSDILKYENGMVNPTLTTIGFLSSGLGINPRELLDFEIDWQTFP